MAAVRQEVEDNSYYPEYGIMQDNMTVPSY